MVYITGASGFATVPLSVTVYDANEVKVDPATVVWSGLPADGSVTHAISGMATLFTSNKVQTVTHVTATVGVASSSLDMVFAAPALKFTSP